MRKGSLKPGQSLILTKPLGSGVIFAADMRGQAKGSWVSGGQPLRMHACLRSSQGRHEVNAAHSGIHSFHLGHGCMRRTLWGCN